MAELAGVPEEILQRARVLLTNFEAMQKQTLADYAVQIPMQVEQQPVVEAELLPPVTIATMEQEETQLSFFDASAPEISPEEREVLDAVMKLNVMGTTPIQAMTMLYELQQKLLAKK